jgi:hypothetical protein
MQQRSCRDLKQLQLRHRQALVLLLLVTQQGVASRIRVVKKGVGVVVQAVRSLDVGTMVAMVVEDRVAGDKGGI